MLNKTWWSALVRYSLHCSKQWEARIPKPNNWSSRTRPIGKERGASSQAMCKALSAIQQWSIKHVNNNMKLLTNQLRTWTSGMASVVSHCFQAPSNRDEIALGSMELEGVNHRNGKGVEKSKSLDGCCFEWWVWSLWRPGDVIQANCITPSHRLVLHKICNGQHNYHNGIDCIMQSYHMTSQTGSLLNMWYVPSVSRSLKTGLPSIGTRHC